MEDEKKFVILVDDFLINLFIGKNVLAKKYTVATVPSAKKNVQSFGEQDTRHYSVGY